MKRFFWVILIFIFTIPITTSAQDLTGTWYLRFETGVATALDPDLRAPELIEADLGSSLYFGGGVGYQLFEKLRTDFTVTYRGGFQQDFEIGNVATGEGDFASTAAMLNINYEFDEWNNLIPFVGVGFGYVYNHLDEISIVSTEGRPLAFINGGGWANFGFQIGGGLTVPVHEKWLFDFGYRYFDGGKYESSDVIHLANGVNMVFAKHVGSLSAHDLTLGLRYRF
jgi:opacity protein-like surface antigen